MTFLRRDTVRCKTAVNNKCLEQVANFKFLGGEISYEKKR
jgi:hypothetical protein